MVKECNSLAPPHAEYKLLPAASQGYTNMCGRLQQWSPVFNFKCRGAKTETEEPTDHVTVHYQSNGIVFQCPV